MSMADQRIALSRRASAEQAGERERGSRSDKPSEGRESGDNNNKRKKRPMGVRILLWLLRKSIVPIIMIVMLVAGLYIGYAVVGKQPGDEVFSVSTWKHLYDLIFSDK
ncbi:DNA-directed RNA polymerase subunit beta [Paenibacillus sp. NPDC058071]|uniref:DNA-directed RNA polymerase subunit beta n=1 Tax=Paenibacillus sp. NPDC058071 TaxID=3346326 RepID=UPI0036DC9865